MEYLVGNIRPRRRANLALAPIFDDARRIFREQRLQIFSCFSSVLFQAHQYAHFGVSTLEIREREGVEPNFAILRLSHFWDALDNTS